jgi:hypothetical protein
MVGAVLHMLIDGVQPAKRLIPELTWVDAVRSGPTQAEACGLHPARGQLK